MILNCIISFMFSNILGMLMGLIWVAMKQNGGLQGSGLQCRCTHF